jgi:hypothetical protein
VNWEVTKPSLFLPGIASVDHATVVATLLATPFAASLGPLTLRLLPVISRIGQLIVHFRSAELTPSACHQFEIQLHGALRELGRIIVEWTYKGVIAPISGIMRLFSGISFRNPPEFALREASSIASRIDALPTTLRSDRSPGGRRSADPLPHSTPSPNASAAG